MHLTCQVVYSQRQLVLTIIIIIITLTISNVPYEIDYNEIDYPDETIQNSLLFPKFHQKLANSDTPKEALNCTTDL